VTKPLGPAAALPRNVVVALREILRREGRLRDLALMNVQIDSCLRAGDVLKLCVRDVTKPDTRIVSQFVVREQKTGKSTRCYLMDEARIALDVYLAKRDASLDAPLVPGRSKDKPMTVAWYQMLVKDWVALLRWNRVELPEGYISTHSFRASKPTYLYEQEKDIIACQHLLGHSNPRTTMRYLRIGPRAAGDLVARHSF
jgi:integrase